MYVHVHAEEGIYSIILCLYSDMILRKVSTITRSFHSEVHGLSVTFTTQTHSSAVDSIINVHIHVQFTCTPPFILTCNLKSVLSVIAPSRLFVGWWGEIFVVLLK